MISRVGFLLIALCLAAGVRAEVAKRPNILVAISDDQSFPHASAYGYRAIKTPAFDRVASSGALFMNAFCASPGCSPSRAAILTGRYPWALEHAGTHASSFSAKYTVYPDILEKAGYVVGFTQKGWSPGNYKEGGRTRNPAGPSVPKVRTKAPTTGMADNNYSGTFEAFLESKEPGKPFCFWYGASEPHRVFEKGSGLRAGKKIEDVVVPPFLPDTTEIRSDMLDYCLEIEHFDRHLGRMLDLLEQRGELENTIVVVTSDNGMAFPRAKANAYEYGIHLPLAIAWPERIPQGQLIEQLTSLIDLAPTFLEAAGIAPPPTEFPMQGMSLLPGLTRADLTKKREFILAGRERHSSSRHENLGYPQRAIRTDSFLLIRNFKPHLWPAGAPQKLDRDGELGPMHGGYHDIDACPTLDFLIEHRDAPDHGLFFHLAVDKRPEIELYNIVTDPGCLVNLADDSEFADVRDEMAKKLEAELRATGDSRLGDDPDIWETYRRYSPIRSFPKP